MSFFDWVFSSKTDQIFQAVLRISGWLSGLDGRLNSIERRLGTIEMALTLEGIKINQAEKPEAPRAD